MRPRFQPGDFVLTLRYWRKKARAGDIVVCRHSEHGAILKQVKESRPQGLLLAGLNELSSSPSALGWIPHEDVAGRVVFRAGRPLHASPS